jgi:lipopolysaccharide/colanic/teichoic acid biosynthesis glycosyltransferase
MTASWVERAPAPVPTSWVVREYALKRCLDLVLASLALVVSAPVWLILAFAIKLEDGGPVFYVQPRWGRNRRSFQAYKFRSMVADADRRFGAVQARKDDERITRIGRLMRATSLDELPQLVNIWRGDMSWVGPRALPMNERQVNEADDRPDHAIPGFDLRCAVRPGLTGVAQVFAPRDIARRRKFRYDALYVRKQNFWLDLRLIALSVWISVRLRWEHRGAKVGARRRARG